MAFDTKSMTIKFVESFMVALSVVTAKQKIWGGRVRVLQSTLVRNCQSESKFFMNLTKKM